MLASFQRHFYSLLDIVTLNVHAIVVMHAASVALMLHGVLLASLAGLIIKSNFSAQTLLLIGLLLNIHPRLLSYIQIPLGSVQEVSQSVEDVLVINKLASIQHETGPHTKNHTHNFERQSRFTAASVDNLRSGFSMTDQGPSIIMDPAESPWTPHSPKRKLRKSVRDRRTFHDDKENEQLSPLRPLTAKGDTLSISHRNGLRPLTLMNNPSLDLKDSFGPRRTVSLFNAARRSSPLLYVSDTGGEHSPSPRSADLFARRVSLPPDGLSRIKMDVSARLQGEIQLTSKLQEEMKLTARLRNDLVELRDRACAELKQSKYEAQALAVAVDARECFIKDLAASVEFLRVENKVLKKANRRDPCENVATEVFTKSRIDEIMQPFSPKFMTREPGQEDVNIANIITKQSGRLKSAREQKLGQRCVKRSSIAFGDLSVTGRDLSFSRDTASWLSLGTVSEPTLEQPRGSMTSLQASPSTFTCDKAEYCEYAMDTPEGYFEVEFPTISPEFPPCRVAALARRKAATSSKGVTIYEVDGRALASYYGNSPSFPHAAGPAHSRHDIHQATTRNSPRCSMNERSDTTHLASDQNCHREASCLAIHQDSPFYPVPASVFIVPRAMCLSLERCP